MAIPETDLKRNALFRSNDMTKNSDIMEALLSSASASSRAIASGHKIRQSLPCLSNQSIPEQSHDIASILSIKASGSNCPGNISRRQGDGSLAEF